MKFKVLMCVIAIQFWGIFWSLFRQSESKKRSPFCFDCVGFFFAGIYTSY